MKKAAFITLAITVFNIFTLTPQANAAFLEDKLLEAVAAHPNAAQIQEVLRWKKELDQGSKNAVVNALLQNILESKAGNGIAAALVTGDIKQTAAAAISQTPYYKELSILAALFNLGGQLEPKTAVANNSLPGAPANYKKMIQMTATAYAPGPADNGKWGNLTHLGTYVRKGVAAVDPRVIPLGTKLWVEGYGEAIAEDTGSAIKGNRIDLAFNNRQEALNYGIQKVNVYVME